MQNELTRTTTNAKKAGRKPSPMLERLLAHGLACSGLGRPDAKPAAERAFRALDPTRES